MTLRAATRTVPSGKGWATKIPCANPFPKSSLNS